MQSEQAQEFNPSEIPFQEIPVTIPDFFYEMIGYDKDARFLSLSYESTNATYFDGSYGSTFNYYYAYEPFINHFAIAFYLDRVGRGCLGTDDSYPTHRLLIDRSTGKLYVGDYRSVTIFLSQNKPKVRYAVTLEELENVTATWGEEEMRKRGMFSLLLRPSPQQLNDRSKLIEYLNTFISAEHMAQLMDVDLTQLKN